MTRMINGDAVKRRILDIVETWKYQGRKYDALLLESVIAQIVDTHPTLTPENEAPPCYQPDGDGCAYQCYDGQDEPIAKCKECPLCYSDKQRHHTPPNEPLTLEQLREMDGEPVWFDTIKRWGIVKVCRDGVFVLTKSGEFEVGRCKYYRRPPEGEEDT